MPARPAIQVIDDDDAVRDSVAFLLSSAGHATECHASAAEFLEALPGLEPLCVITDVRMPDMTGIELLTRLSATRPDVPVIVITGHGDIPLAVEAMRLGAHDFLEKPFNDDALLASVARAVTTGRADAERQAERAEILRRLAGISGRERQVLEGLIAGKSNKVIAFDLDISSRTVEVYRANLMTKLQAGTLSDLVRMALVAGIGARPKA